MTTRRTELQVFYANGGPEWNSMDKTLIFSEENEMDMTSGHTIMITHDNKNGQESDNSEKIDFKSFSTELKSKKEASQVNKFNCFSGPTMNNDACLSQHKTNTENTQKVNFSDFLKTLKSTKQFPTSTADIVASEDNVLQEEKYNTITISKGLKDNKQNYIMPILSNTDSSLALKQLGFQELTPAAQKESVDIANRKRSLPLGTNIFNSVSEQENLQRDHSVSYNMKSSRLNTSNYQLGFQMEPSMYINEKHMNRTEVNSGQKKSVVTKSDTLLPCYKTSAMPVPTGSVTSTSVLPKDTTTFLNFSAGMEAARKRSGLIWEDNSKKTSYPFREHPEKQNDVFHLDRTTCKDGRMDISTDFLKNPHHSILGNEKFAPNEEVTYNMGLLNPRIKHAPQATYVHEKKENDYFHGDELSRSSVFFPENGSLSSNFISKSSRKQRESQFLSLPDYKAPTAVHSKRNRRSGLSNNAESLIPEDKSATLIFSQNMDITKCITNLTNNPDAAVFQNMSQEERGTSTKSVTKLDSNKTVLFSLTGYNEMEITKSHTVPVNFDMLQHERTPQPLSLQSTDKTVYMYHSDMDETKAITGIIHQPMENPKDPEMHKRTNEYVRRTLTGTTGDRTTVFSLSDENGMEISRSHTVALDHDVVTQGGEIPTMSFVPSSKTDVFAFGEHMDIANPITSLTDKSLRSVTDSFAVLEQKAKPGERISGLTSAKSIHSSNEDNEMKPIDSLMVTVEEAPQALSSVLPEKAMSVHCSSKAKNKALPSVAADKTEFFLHNNDMEITKPVIYRSLEDTALKNMEWSIQETGKILSGTAKEKTATQLQEVSEMEITRSHTVAVNHEILQQVQLATQGLISALADKKNMPIHSSDTTTTQSTSFVPVDKTVLFLNNNNMEVTKSESAAFLKNSCSAYLSQKGKETKEITLSGSVEDKTSVLALHDDEMEMTKCHTVAVAYDIFPKCDNLPQELFCQDNMDIIESHTITESAEENLHKNATKFGKHAQWDLSSKHTVALAIDDMDVSERDKITFDCKRSLHYLPHSQPKLPFSVNDTNAFVSYQDGTKVSNLETNTVDSRDLEKSVRQEMPKKSIQQNSVNVLPIAYGGKTQDTEFPENHTVTIYGCNNVPDIENQIQNLFTNSKGGENMEMTRNYTTGIECMHMNDKNKCYLNSQAKSNSEFSASSLTHEKKLYISQTERVEYSICTDTDMLLLPQEQQNILKTNDNQLQFCISDINNFGKDATLHSVPNEEIDFMFLVNMQDLDPKLSEENSHDLKTSKMCIPMSESKSSKDDPMSWPRQEPPRETSDLSNDGKVTNMCEAGSGERNSHTKDLQNNVQSFPINTFLSEEKSILFHKISDAATTCLKLKHTGKKSQPDLVSQDVESCLGGALPELTVKTDDPSVSREDAKESNIFSKNWSNTGFTENASFKVPLNTVCIDSCKIKKMPLGIFPPKLPNKRKSSLTNVDGTAAKSEKRREIHDSEEGLLVKSPSDKIIADLSPSSYINQELLPSYVEEMDSDESLNCNVPEKICEVMKGKEAAEKEGQLSEMYETNKRQRGLNQEDEELQKEKKFKGNQDWNDTADLTQVGIKLLICLIVS